MNGMSNRLDRNGNGLHQPRRLALVDADVRLLHALCEHFAAQKNGWQVEAYTSPAEAWKAITARPSDVVLMDSFPAKPEQTDWLRTIQAGLPDLPVVLHVREVQSRVLLKAMMAGVRGCLIKPLPVADVLAQVNKVLAGGLALCPRAERLLLEGLRGLGRAKPALGLSRREQDVMFCLCQHRSNKECAAVLGISETTVHAHLASIFRKLQVHDRESALGLFMRQVQVGGGGGVKPSGAAPPALDLF